MTITYRINGKVTKIYRSLSADKAERIMQQTESEWRASVGGDDNAAITIERVENTLSVLTTEDAVLTWTLNG